jgi:hypothetical protein
MRQGSLPRKEWNGAHSKRTTLAGYFRGNQLDPTWYLTNRNQRIPVYEYEVITTEPMRAVMSKVAAQPGSPTRTEPGKFQYYTPLGLGRPKRKRLLGYLEISGKFSPL